MTEANTQHDSTRWRWRLLVLVILAAGAGGLVALQLLKPRPAVSPSVKQLPLVRVAPVEMREGALAVAGHGLIKPRTEVALAAELSGRVTFVSPDLVTGGRFAQGDVLMRIDPEPFRAALAQAVAERQSAQASLELAEQQLKRTEQLIAQNFLARQTLDERLASRDQARAQLARAEAVEKSRQIDLDRTVIRAPFKGRVLSEKVDPGETVQPGKELARIFADDTLEIAVSLTDREVALIADPWRTPGGGKQPDASATVTVEHGGARYRWPARVDRVEAAVDSATRTFNVVVRVDNPGARGEPVSGGAEAAPPLLVGMYATVEITGRDAGRYALVPRRALRDGSRVWLLADGNVVAIRPVIVIYDAGDETAVAGLDGTSRVIVSDLKVVTEGMPVRVLEAKARAP
ncbi:MAG: efflux RND transporter periplasmic adaptor subunit [Betaproteobacteria bacterium]|nr:efflux RND transporter periplasmic adaptor subunit [Betaproteobacteria bacterium]